MTITLYGIPNCDTVKKARQWLTSNGIDYRFHDFRKDGLDAKQLKKWLDTVGWETLLNRKGTTWRQLPEAVRDSTNAGNVAKLLLEHSTLIKRPVLENGASVRCGFSAAEYQAAFR
ncbi:MAG TPA: ArsC family reductase [Dongiaceae bacterium]|nr:ArsC family reductase [Dongiaceae bacterium]